MMDYLHSVPVRALILEQAFQRELMVLACLSRFRYGSITTPSSAGAQTPMSVAEESCLPRFSETNKACVRWTVGELEACSKTPSIRGRDFHTTEGQDSYIRRGCR